MFMKFYEMMFIMLLMTGTITAASSASWFTSWVGLELNLLMMIPLIINKYSPISTESVIKYFLVQAMSSTLFIIFSMMNFLFMKSNFFFNSEMLILFTLCMKAGIPPLHFWFPQIIEYMEWNKCIILMTWQKIAPFVLMSFMMSNLMIYLILLSSMIGMIGGFNQNSMKKILAYSSILHSSWMLSIIMINIKIWLNYFLIYSVITVSIISMIMINQIKDIKSIMFNKIAFKQKMIFILNIFSLAGLPPFLGFLGKFLIIKYLLNYNFNLFIMTILIMSSLIGLFFYMKMIYSMLMIKNNSMNLLMTEKHSNMKTMLINFSILANLIIPVIMLLT